MSVEFEIRDHIAIITLNRPQARNAINNVMATGVEAALDRYEADPDLWVAVLRGEGPVFCAGADLKEISAGNGASLSTERGGFGGIVKRERTKPVIAAVHGSAVAGGCEICLSCDLIVAAEGTNFGLPEVKRSLVAGAGGLFRLPRAVGMAPAMEMILTGDPIQAERAYQLGLVSRVAPVDGLLDAALELAGRIAANAPLAVQESRNVAVTALSDSDDNLWLESRAALARLSKTEDYAEGPRAFVEKRAPVWKGR
jgi:enoyl-CoA hydratase